MKAAALSLVLVFTTGCASIERVFDGHPNGIANTKTAGYFLQEENDSLTPEHFGLNLDNHYTQGLRWGKTINPSHNPKAINSFADAFCKWFCRQLSYDRPVWTSGIAQTMFTPNDLTIDAPQPNDRPWAGFIYLDNIIRMTEDTSNPSRQVVLELQTGHVGKRSGAEWAQSALHAILPTSPHPTWHEQLERDIAAAAILQYNWRHGNEHVDVLPFAGGALGNTQSYLNGGLYARLGWNMAGFFNTGVMQGTYAVGRENDERPTTEGFVYAGGNVAWIPYNFFLKGPEIDPEPFVYDFLWGASFRYRSYRLTLNFADRSREFTHPNAPPEVPPRHQFGSVVISYELIIPQR